MERHFPARREAPVKYDQVFDGTAGDPRAARDVAPGECWAFVEHRTLAEVIAAERQP